MLAEVRVEKMEKDQGGERTGLRVDVRRRQKVEDEITEVHWERIAVE